LLLINQASREWFGMDSDSLFEDEHFKGKKNGGNFISEGLAKMHSGLNDGEEAKHFIFRKLIF
jgi:hypothetical protein